MLKFSISGLLNQKNERLQLFLTCGATKKASVTLTLKETLLDHVPSTVGTLKAENKVIKLIKPRSWHEHFKIYWGKGRLFEEIRGNRLFQDIGIQTPLIYQYGVSLVPKPSNQYIGYYVMENLTSSGYQLAYESFNHSANPKKRQAVLAAFIHDLQIIKQNRLVFIDLHLGQVYCNDKNQLCWLDIGVKHYSEKQQKRFQQRFNTSINRLLVDTNSQFLAEEKAQIEALKISP